MDETQTAAAMRPIFRWVVAGANLTEPSPTDKATLMIDLVTTMKTRSGHRQTLLSMLKELTPTIHREPGCAAYQPMIDAADLGDQHAKLGPDTFIVLERWESVEDLRVHGASPHMLDFLAKARPMLASLTINILSPA